MKSLVIFLLLSAICLISTASAQDAILYAWAGAADGNSSDVLMTLDADENSSTYGEMISVSPLNSSGNEPHHHGMTKNRKWVCGGGLLSFFKAQDEIFCFDVETDPYRPALNWTVDIEHLACPDEFRPLGPNLLVVTMMCNATGGSPGGIIILNPGEQSYKYFVPKAHQSDPMAYWEEHTPNSNPHGISIERSTNRMVSTDYILPASAVSGPIVPRDTINVYNLNKKKFLDTFSLDGANGLMDVNFLPRRTGWALSCGNGNHKMYTYYTKGLKKTGGVTDINVAFDLAVIYGTNSSAGVMSTMKDRVIAPFQFRYLLLLDTSDLASFSILDEYDFGEFVGAHYTRLSKDNKVVALCNYFLDMGDSGIVDIDGDHKIHLFDILQKEKFSKRDTFFDLSTIYDYDLRPHAVLWFYPNE